MNTHRYVFTDRETGRELIVILGKSDEAAAWNKLREYYFFDAAFTGNLREQFSCTHMTGELIF